MGTDVEPLACWFGALNFDLCCRGPWGEGQSACWDGYFTWERCCLPELEARDDYSNITAAGGTDGAPPTVVTQVTKVVAGPDSPAWLRSMTECLHAYDMPENRRWFLSHSSVLAHFTAHVGNPAACVDGGHHYYWGLLIVSLNLASGHTEAYSTMGDVGLEFGLCVPNTCAFSVVDAVLAPFYLGPYMGKPWGPPPEIIGRFQERKLESEVSTGDWKVSAEAFVGSILTGGPGYKEQFYAEQWPYRQGLFKYEPTWMPSQENLTVLALLSVLPLIAGLCAACGCGRRRPHSAPKLHDTSASVSVLQAADEDVARNGVARLAATSSGARGGGRTASGRGAGARGAGRQGHAAAAPDSGPADEAVGSIVSRFAGAVGFAVHTFSPQRHLQELFEPAKLDFAGIHSIRLVLQALVCWQHVILLVDWLGNAGHHGIVAFAPLTNDLAETFGRVNTTFACLTAYFSFRSMAHTLAAAERDGARSGPSRWFRTTLIFLMWIVRRWVRQAAELAFWTFCYLRVSQDVPWKPFPDFVQVWYKDRIRACLKWPKPGRLQLPMWLLSLLFVYEPVNSIFHLHPALVSLCHNMQVFENLFAISLAGALLAAARHCGGRLGLFSVAGAMVALAIRREPDMFDDKSMFLRPGDKDGREMIAWSTPSMLPAAISSVLLLAEFFPPGATSAEEDVASRSRPLWRRPWCLPCFVIFVGLAADFLVMGHGHLLAAYVPHAAGAAAVRRALLALAWALSTYPMAAWGIREGAHALGVALLLRAIGANGSTSTGQSSGWTRALSRLSLGINLVNIFAIHYLRGRILDHPIEFSQIHVLLYTVFAWVAAVAAGLLVHCLVSPHVVLVESLLRRLGKCMGLEGSRHLRAGST